MVFLEKLLYLVGLHEVKKLDLRDEMPPGTIWMWNSLQDTANGFV